MNDLTSIKRYDGLIGLSHGVASTHCVISIVLFERLFETSASYNVMAGTHFFGICWVKQQLQPSAVRILWYSIQMMLSHSNNYLIPLLMLVNSCHHGCVYVCVCTVDFFL